MRTIRKTAKNVLRENVDYINELFERFGRSEDMFRIDTLRKYTEWQALTNPDFFKWLFNDKNISSYGENLTGEQMNDYKTWLNDL